jgi:hypothetical protein
MLIRHWNAGNVVSARSVHVDITEFHLVVANQFMASSITPGLFRDSAMPGIFTQARFAKRLGSRIVNVGQVGVVVRSQLVASMAFFFSAGDMLIVASERRNVVSARSVPSTHHWVSSLLRSQFMASSITRAFSWRQGHAWHHTSKVSKRLGGRSQRRPNWGRCSAASPSHRRAFFFQQETC